MKMIIAIVSSDDASNVQKGLIKEHYQATKLATTGGFLMKGNTTFLIGTEDEKVNDIIQIIGNHSKTRKKIIPNSVINEFGMLATSPVEVTVGGATIFVLNIENFVKL
jgi:uncharacterized protein YaaQ